MNKGGTPQVLIGQTRQTRTSFRDAGVDAAVEKKTARSRVDQAQPIERW